LQVAAGDKQIAISVIVEVDETIAPGHLIQRATPAPAVGDILEQSSARLW
jgi:hypothetical protein